MAFSAPFNRIQCPIQCPEKPAMKTTFTDQIANLLWQAEIDPRYLPEAEKMLASWVDFRVRHGKSGERVIAGIRGMITQKKKHRPDLEKAFRKLAKKPKVKPTR